MATKKELEDQLKTLKTRYKEVSDKVKELAGRDNPQLGENPFKALGVFMDEEGYKLVQIDYNPETRASEITKIGLASKVPNSYPLATYQFNKYVNEIIFEDMRGKNV